ncbi:MAG: AAA family ATPase [Polyangiaceae bacterium]
MTATSDAPPGGVLRDVAIYNPDLLRKEELIAYFIARRPLLERILADLRGGESAQHHLLIGTRGMGKTTLLRRIRFAIEDDERLSAEWLPLTFPEEQYSVTRLSDLYLNCIDALSDALEERGEEATARELDRQVAALAGESEENRSRRALAILLGSAKELKKRLVLLLDNIDILFDRLKPQGWALRETLSRESSLVIVGASASHPETTYTYEAPFYDFFKVHELGGLSEEDARRLLLHISDVRGTAHVRKVIEGERARLRTLHTLSGGNPRTLVLLYFVLAQSTEGDARTDLERLLDHITPLYKARIEALSVQAQKIVDAIAVHWHPITAAETAQRTQLEVGLVSSQITRLVREGVLERAPVPAGSKMAFQVAERLLGIWYLMRQSRRVRQRLVWLVEFLRLCYGAEELASHARTHLGRLAPREAGSRVRHVEYRLALAEAVGDSPLRNALESSAMHAIVEDRSLRERLAKIVDLEGDDAGLRPVVDRHRAAVELREKVLAAKVDVPGWDAAEFAELLGGHWGLRIEEKLAIVSRLEDVGTTQIEEIKQNLRRQTEVLQRYHQSPQLGRALRLALAHGYMADAGDVDGAQAAAIIFESPQLPVLSVLLRDGDKLEEPLLSRCEQWCLSGGGFARAWGALAERFVGAGQVTRGVAAYRHAIDLDPSDARLWNNLGNLLHYHLLRFDEAEQAYRRAIELDRSYARPWQDLGSLLQEHLMRPDEAEHAHLRATELAPDDATTWNSLAWCRYLNGDLDDETEAAARNAMSREPEDLFVAHTLACVLVRRGKWDEPADLMSRVIQLGSAELLERRWNDIVRFFADCAQMGKRGPAVELLDRIGFGERWQPLRAALSATEEGRESLLRLAPEMRAPAEVIFERLVQLSGTGDAAVESPTKRRDRKK